MTTNEPTVNAAIASAILGSLIVRSVSLAAGVALAILLVAALLAIQ